MIEQEKYVINDKEFDRRICPSDWRYSASIVGMIRYFDYHNISYKVENQYLYYNYETVNNESDSKYMEFVEKKYAKRMHHVELECLLDINEKTDEDYRQIKDKLKANAIMRKVFKGIKEKNDPEDIKYLIDENRENIIGQTFKGAHYGYSKFANSYKFRSESDKVCRLNGYYVDTGRKTKSISFGFDNKTRNYSDHIEFDFIPFAFTNNRESIFINNNISINNLLRTNNKIESNMRNYNDNNFRSIIFYSYQEGSEYIDFDVEIIIKEMNKEYFETIFVRKEATDIFKSIKKMDKDTDYIKLALNHRSIKITDDFYINVMKEVTESILNLVVLDNLILFLFSLEGGKKQNGENKKSRYGFLVSQLTKINKIIYKKKALIKGDNKMSYRNVRQCVGQVKKKLTGRSMRHKLDSYRSKLIGALVANDNDRFIEIMLQLQSYTQVPFEFLHYLIVDFEGNKNLAYDFVNQLNFFGLENEEKKEEVKE